MSLADRVANWLRPLRFRGKGRLLDPLIARGGVRTATVFGSQMELDLGDLIQRQVYLGVYEREETNHVLRFLRPGMTFVDVGANIGYYTVMAAARVGPRGRVVAVEPSPYAGERLEKAVRENELTNVLVFRGGLGDRAGECRLLIPPPGNHTPTMLGDEEAPAHVVTVKTLDACLADWRVETIDLMKMDVEGFEPRVLAGASTALAAERIGAILCEFNDYWLRKAGTSALAFYDSILAKGFVDREGRPRSFDGQNVTRLLVRKNRND
jgi:FkbM family methyltransferase